MTTNTACNTKKVQTLTKALIEVYLLGQNNDRKQSASARKSTKKLMESD